MNISYFLMSNWNIHISFEKMLSYIIYLFLLKAYLYILLCDSDSDILLHSYWNHELLYYIFFIEDFSRYHGMHLVNKKAVYWNKILFRKYLKILQVLIYYFPAILIYSLLFGSWIVKFNIQKYFCMTKVYVIIFSLLFCYEISILINVSAYCRFNKITKCAI